MNLTISNTSLNLRKFIRARLLKILFQNTFLDLLIQHFPSQNQTHSSNLHLVLLKEFELILLDTQVPMFFLISFKPSVSASALKADFHL